MIEKHSRSMIKSIIWRIMGILILAGITFFFTGSWVVSILIAITHHTAFIFIYYFHERVWLKSKIGGKKRYLMKMFTYEIVLGNLVLGTISYIFTGSWTAVTLITLVYIGNKLWIYLLYEYVWNKIKWGRVSDASSRTNK